MRVTNQGFYAFHVARMVHMGTEALQSFFLPPGVLSMKIMARDQGLDSFPASACEVKSLPLQIVLFGRASSLVEAGASRTSYSRPLSRWVRVRSMARMVHRGTEALQSFFSAPAGIAWHVEEKILP